jgi:hypothetical protein
MTEQAAVEAVLTPEVAEEAQVPPSPDEMRIYLYKTVTDVYAALMGVFDKLPLHSQIKANALVRFDEGLLWTREGISMLKFQTPEEAEANTPAAEQNTPAAEQNTPADNVVPLEVEPAEVAHNCT